VDRQNLLHRLRLNEHTSLDQYIESKRLFEGKPLIFNHDDLLIHRGQLSQLKLFKEAPLVNGLNQTGALVTVDLDRRADD